MGEGNGTPLQYSCLENPMDGGAWWAAVHGVAKSRIRLSDFTFHFHALEKEMATHSSILAWRIPGMGAWWAAVYGVTQSQTRLKHLSSNSSSRSSPLSKQAEKTPPTVSISSYQAEGGFLPGTGLSLELKLSACSMKGSTSDLSPAL